jgi:hypothetical protein
MRYKMVVAGGFFSCLRLDELGIRDRLSTLRFGEFSCWKTMDGRMGAAESRTRSPAAHSNDVPVNSPDLDSKTGAAGCWIRLRVPTES